ncbi:DUF6213 family protein [Kitasatospora sp. NPDC089797]|uniref:DUF6213 family protein n=1 Tax=Kitasatospora sp. NPDC089797 TaxID=3155298 RepID=UPI003444B06E
MEYHHGEGEQHFRLPVRRDQHGTLVVPAGHVTGLLRAIAATWQEWAAGAVPGMDPATTTGLGAVLEHLADQLDVQCIAQTDSRD